MKKRRLLVFGFMFTAMLTLSSCEFFIPLFGNTSDPYTYKTEPPTSSDTESSSR